MNNSLAWFAVSGTVLMTVYGQLVIKWRVLAMSPVGGGFWKTLLHVLTLFMDPWVVSALLAALGAAVCWMLAMTKLPLSLAYPFTSLAVLLVTAVGVLLFNESIGYSKCAGVVLVIAGLAVLYSGQTSH